VVIAVSFLAGPGRAEPESVRNRTVRGQYRIPVRASGPVACWVPAAAPGYGYPVADSGTDTDRPRRGAMMSSMSP